MTKRKSKSGKNYLELSIKKEQGYEKYLCFESDKKDQYGNEMFSVMVKQDNPAPKKEDPNDLPF